MKDFLGNTLEIGDKCVIIEPNYRNFLKATIINFSHVRVRLQFNKDYGKREIIQSPDQLVKIIKENV